MGDRETGEGTRHREQQALGQRLAHEAAPRGAERVPHRHLAAARLRPREQERRDVGAGQEQDQRDRPQHHHQRRAHAARHVILQRPHRHAQVLVRLRVLPRQVVGDGGHRRPRLLQARPLRQPRHRPEVVAAPVLEIARGPHGDPQVDGDRHLSGNGVGKPEGRRHHADDRVARPVDADGAADHLRVGAEAPPPERVAEDRDRGPAAEVLAGQERAAEQRPHPEHREETVGGLEAEHGLRALGAHEGHEPVTVGGDLREDARSRAPVAEVGKRNPVRFSAGAEARFVELHEAVGLLVGQRPQHDRVDQAEDGGGRADAQGQRGHDRRGEPRPPRQQPQREARVLHETVPEERASGLVEALARGGDVAERAARRGLASSRLRPLSRSRSISSCRCASISASKSACVRRCRDTGSPPGRLGPEHAPDRGHDPAPAAGGACELGAARARERVETGPAVVVGGPPLRVDPAPRLQALQRRIERSVLDEQHVVGGLLDGPRDALAVLRAEHERAQDQEVQRALEQGHAVDVVTGRHST